MKKMKCAVCGKEIEEGKAIEIGMNVMDERGIKLGGGDVMGSGRVKDVVCSDECMRNYYSH